MPPDAKLIPYHAGMSDASEPMPPAGPALRDAKRNLRNATIAARDALDPMARARDSQAIVARVAALPSFVRASCVLLTLPFRSEWDSTPLLDAVLARCAAAVLPRVDVATRMLVLHRVRDPDSDIAPGYRGIPEPLPHLPTVEVREVDWMLVPGVAFDSTGRRLGYGGGYYDRLLPLASAGVPRVAGAFDLQVLAQVPWAPHDLTVDTIVLPGGTVVTAR